MTETKTDNNSRRPVITGAPVPKEDSRRRSMARGGMTVDQILAAAALDLRKIYPFLFAALYAVPRVESNEVAGISVSPGTLYYNSWFVQHCSRASLVYHLAHGLYHILMRHHIRGQMKDPARWNHACDLYINKCLADAYGALPGEGPVIVTNDDGESILFEIPEGEAFNEVVDIRRDTPESIYTELSPSDEEGDTDDQSHGDDIGAGKNSGNDEARDREGKSPDEGKGENESDKEGTDERNEQDHPTEDKTSEENAASDQESHDPSDADSSGDEGDKGRQEETGDDGDDNEEGTPKNPDIHDLVDDTKSLSMSTASLAQETNRLYAKIETINRQLSEFTMGRGTKHDPVAQIEIDEQNTPRVNWRALLRNKLIKVTTDEKSLSHPDRRFVHTGLYLEGVVSEEIELKDIKVCVDTSASMSDRDIQIALFQIRDLIRTYRLSAELVFWDEMIEEIQPFKDQHEFKIARAMAYGRGGTNPECLFEAFDQRNSRGHTAPPPSLIIILTDGVFDPPDPKYRRTFDDKTLWVLCADNSKTLGDFDPGFGTVTELTM